MDNMSSAGGQLNSAGSEFTNWRYDGYNQRFPYLPLIYTQPYYPAPTLGGFYLGQGYPADAKGQLASAVAAAALSSTLLLMGVG